VRLAFLDIEIGVVNFCYCIKICNSYIQKSERLWKSSLLWR